MRTLSLQHGGVAHAMQLSLNAPVAFLERSTYSSLAAQLRLQPRHHQRVPLHSLHLILPSSSRAA